jgi:hypothetical protein
MRTALTAVAAAAVFATAACGSGEPPNLAGEYIESNDVKNDVYPTAATPEDRMANLASMGSPEAIIASLFFPVPCSEADTNVGECTPNGAAYTAIEDFSGADPEFFMRFILARYEDETLELIPLYVARNPSGDMALIDTEGARYEHLDDFRRHNDLLEFGDWIMTANDITDVEGEIDVVTVSGRTTPGWVPWLIGTGAALLLAIAATIVVRRRYYRSQIQPEEPS